MLSRKAPLCLMQALELMYGGIVGALWFTLRGSELSTVVTIHVDGCIQCFWDYLEHKVHHF